MKFVMLSLALGFIFGMTTSFTQKRGGYSDEPGNTNTYNMPSFMNGNYSNGVNLANSFDGIVKNIVVKNNLDKPGIIVYKSFLMVIMVPQNSFLENLNPVIFNMILSRRYCDN